MYICSTVTAIEQLPSRVRAERKLLGVTQQQLADLAGVSVGFVHALESGKRSRNLAKVAAVLDVVGLELTIVPKSVDPASPNRTE